jgi:hypothetical protein
MEVGRWVSLRQRDRTITRDMTTNPAELPPKPSGPFEDRKGFSKRAP